jgi:hypothetical protein
MFNIFVHLIYTIYLKWPDLQLKFEKKTIVQTLNLLGKKYKVDFNKTEIDSLNKVEPELKIELTGIYTDGNITSTFEVTTDSIKLKSSKLNRKR